MALLLFALGLMAKPMLVTLPGILCLLDWWPLRRFELPMKSQPKTVLVRILIEKIPFILLAVLSCWITYIAQNSTGAVKSDSDFELAQRLRHIPVSYAWYIFKLFLPVNLSVFYPLRAVDSAGEAVLASTLLLLVTAFAFWRARQFPYILVGWLWFVGALVPVIGIVQAGSQAYADRYTYIPYIGLFIMLAWGIPELLTQWRYRRAILCAGAVLVATACFWRTTVEVQYWKNGLTLFGRAIALNSENEMPWVMLGLEYEVRGNNEKAIECVSRATELNNQFNLAWYELGHMLVVKGDYAGAVKAYQTALACFSYQGKKIELYNDLGDVFTTLGQYAQAIASYQSSLELSANQPDIQYKLAQCLADNGQAGQAIDLYENILQSHPDHLPTQLHLAMLLGDSGQDAGAIEHYQKVIELDTNTLVALNNLAWLLATDSNPDLRNGKAAVPLAEHACELTHFQEAIFIGTLAAAYAEAGQFNDAVDAAKKARDVAQAQGKPAIADRNAQLMELYQSGRAFHRDAQTPP